jgi:hypothetical protein
MGTTGRKGGQSKTRKPVILAPKGKAGRPNNKGLLEMITIGKLSLGLVLSLGFASAAVAGPDLSPKFNSGNGSVRVTNVGDADAASTWVTVSCAASGGGSCPDPAPADAAAYLNPAFPNMVAIEVPPLAPGAQHTHVIAFFGGLAFAPGSYSFTVCADAGADVAEDNERNCVVVKKSVRGRPGGPTDLKSNS